MAQVAQGSSNKRLAAAIALTAGLVAWPIVDTFVLDAPPFPRVRSRDSQDSRIGLSRPERKLQWVFTDGIPPADPIACPGSVGTSTAAMEKQIRDALRKVRGGALADEDQPDHHRLIVDVACRAKDEAAARAIAQELGGYFRVWPHLYLRPPWEPGFRITPEQEDARNTFWSVTANEGSYDLLEPKPPRQVDRTVIDGIQKLENTEIPRDERIEMAAKLGVRMGQRPLSPLGPGQKPEPADAKAYGAYGVAAVRGTEVRVGTIQFEHTAIGLPAFVSHLCARGCSQDMRYRVGAAPKLPGD